MYSWVNSRTTLPATGATAVTTASAEANEPCPDIEDGEPDPTADDPAADASVPSGAGAGSGTDAGSSGGSGNRVTGSSRSSDRS
jgi:hypothetical protein